MKRCTGRGNLLASNDEFRKYEVMKWLGALKSIYSERYGKDDLVQQVLVEEGRHGALILNRLRYFFVVLFLAMVFINIEIGNLAVNLGITLAYLLVTLAHSLLLRRNNEKVLRSFDYAAIAFDFLLFIGVNLYYNFSRVPDNIAMTIKSPLIFFLVLPIAMTILQFRLKLTLFAMLAFSLIFTGVIVLGQFTGIVYVNDWPEYILGDGVLKSDVFVSRPLVILGVGIIVYYAIIRSIRLVRRIAMAETQKASLARYFSPDVADEIANNPEMMSKGSRQKVSILFSDIRSFTAMSEKMTPDELGTMLSEFRDIMARAVFDNGGTLDKFIGDAIMANFGTPQPSPDPKVDTENAVKAGIAMMAVLRAYNDTRAKDGKPEIKIGIGIHTGEVFVGNLGSAGNMEYTVIGDTVNTAARIESLCKKLKVDFLISEQVSKEISDEFETRAMPAVKVKGKSKPLKVYQVLHDQT